MNCAPTPCIAVHRVLRGATLEFSGTGACKFTKQAIAADRFSRCERTAKQVLIRVSEPILLFILRRLNKNS